MAELNEILGNERIKEHFITAVHHKKISHAYIINGERSSGKPKRGGAGRAAGGDGRRGTWRGARYGAL